MEKADEMRADRGNVESMKNADLVTAAAPLLRSMIVARLSGPKALRHLDDLHSVATLTMIMMAPKFDPRGIAFTSFVYQRAVGSAFDEYRKLYPDAREDRRASIQRTNRMYFQSIPETGDARKEWHGAARLIAQVMRSLRPRLQRVLKMRYVLGMSIKEIAQELCVNNSRVSQLHTEGLRALRAELERRGVRKVGDVI